MNRQKWYEHWRQQRIGREKFTTSVCSLNEVLRELYGHHYTEKQRAFIHLVSRYRDMLPKSYVEKIESWKPEAKRLADEFIKDITYNKNPFLSLLPKSDFSGVYLPVPVAFNESDDE